MIPHRHRRSIVFGFALFFLSARPGYSCISGPDAAPIQQALDRGEDAVLCPNTTFLLKDTIHFRRDDLSLYTEGRPTDGSRALLKIASDHMVGKNLFTTAIEALGRSRIQITHIQIDGSRDNGNQYDHDSVSALIEAGASPSVGLIVDHVRAYRPRGWTILHVIEGARQAKINRNYFGPSGYPAGDAWADGISMGASDSEVIGNVIEDPTDGGIVLFGPTGTKFIGNTIRSKTVPTLGGINIVDFGPTTGDFSGIVVDRNSIIAQGAMVKTAMAMGPKIWYCDTDGLWWVPGGINRGATITNNLLAGNRMGYGLAANGVAQWTVRGNVSHAKYRGKNRNLCRTLPFPGQPSGVAIINPDPSEATAFLPNTLFPDTNSGSYDQSAQYRRLIDLIDQGPSSYALDSEFIDQTVPERMEAGKRYTVRLTFKNTGTQTWTSGSHRLGSLNPQDNSTWGLGRVDLTGFVGTGQSYTFQLEVTAPTLAGQYHMQWGTLQENLEWFGDVSNNVVIDVVAPAQPLKITEVASETPTPITGKTANLRVSAVHPTGQPEQIMYHWEGDAQNPSPVSFSSNDSNAAQQTVVTFGKSGSYQIKVAATIPGQAVSASLSLTVTSVLDSLLITPDAVTLMPTQSVQLTALGKDQFADPIGVLPVWSLPQNVGLIDANGKLTVNAAASNGIYTIGASAENKTATATLTVVNDSSHLPPIPPRSGGLIDTLPLLELPEEIPPTGIITAVVDNQYQFVSYSWSFYPETTVGTPPVTGAPPTRNVDLRATTNESRIELNALRLSPNVRYRVVLVATTSDRKQSRPAEGFFTIRTLTAPPPASLASVYPSPWRSDRNPTDPISFADLKPGSDVKIFNLSGRWVNSVTADGSGIARWNLRTSSGDTAASGLYLYVGQDPNGSRRRGKFAIIR